ncbi:dihydrofolate reductase family protein [Actinacidiphila acidipaludis]|uniref:Dihydrofolate reductase family protein n=1 Tax=Actinacidiphila acidipaludis TaxID=2873382 RepID=A0ABS7QCQ1_9ACTN|nr:dihydrofolate reductase family protein [Streptomyces acidipaludis]MBY8880931.1 dihydrofolate reductase family protein [Streptomyces acidipaludis]
MRRIVHLVHTSVDGFIEGPAGEFDWPVMGPELSAYVDEVDRGIGTFLYGRVVWQMMASFWPNAEEISDSPHVRKFAPRWRAMPKVVVSRTLPQPGDTAVRVLRGDALAEVAALKAEPGKDILLTGGTELASHLAAAGLLDEWVVAVHPLVLGGGRRLFTQQKERTPLRLVESRTVDGQVVVSRFAAS